MLSKQIKKPTKQQTMQQNSEVVNLCLFPAVLRMGKVPEDCKGISIPILKQGKEGRGDK